MSSKKLDSVTAELLLAVMINIKLMSTAQFDKPGVAQAEDSLKMRIYSSSLRPRMCSF